jgi:hypothetical protein
MVSSKKAWPRSSAMRTAQRSVLDAERITLSGPT